MPIIPRNEATVKPLPHGNTMHVVNYVLLWTLHISHVLKKKEIIRMLVLCAWWCYEGTFSKVMVMCIFSFVLFQRSTIFTPHGTQLKCLAFSFEPCLRRNKWNDYVWKTASTIAMAVTFAIIRILQTDRTKKSPHFQWLWKTEMESMKKLIVKKYLWNEHNYKYLAQNLIHIVVSMHFHFLASWLHSLLTLA